MLWDVEMDPGAKQEFAYDWPVNIALVQRPGGLHRGLHIAKAFWKLCCRAVGPNQFVMSGISEHWSALGSHLAPRSPPADNTLLRQVAPPHLRPLPFGLAGLLGKRSGFPATAPWDEGCSYRCLLGSPHYHQKVNFSSTVLFFYDTKYLK